MSTNTPVASTEVSSRLEVEAFDTFWQEILKLRSLVQRLLLDHQTVRILEVGCGSCSYVLGIKEACTLQNTLISGIDISEKQLKRNPILNESILGDIQTYPLKKDEFDLIVCWWVLEHLEHPEKALLNCQQALKEDGIIVIAVPNVFSLKGLITKFTPHWFHIWIYRHIFNQKQAGTDDHPPFRTFLRFSIAPERIRAIAQKMGLSVEYLSLYEDPKHQEFRQRYRLTGNVWKLIHSLAKSLSFGHVEAESTDYILVLRKPKPYSGSLSA